MKKLFDEYRVFLSYPWDMRVLLVTNLIYAFVMPVVEMFIGAYVMRKSDDVKMVVTYQLAVYAGIPLTFFINGWLLRHGFGFLNVSYPGLKPITLEPGKPVEHLAEEVRKRLGDRLVRIHPASMRRGQPPGP